MEAMPIPSCIRGIENEGINPNEADESNPNTIPLNFVIVFFLLILITIFQHNPLQKYRQFPEKVYLFYVHYYCFVLNGILLIQNL